MQYNTQKFLHSIIVMTKHVLPFTAANDGGWYTIIIIKRIVNYLLMTRRINLLIILLLSTTLLSLRHEKLLRFHSLLLYNVQYRTTRKVMRGAESLLGTLLHYVLVLYIVIFRTNYVSSYFAIDMIFSITES